MGRAFEAHQCHSRIGPDIDRAGYWYDRALRAGNLNAEYRAGYLLKAQILEVTDEKGDRHPDVANGQKMMDYAVAHGYDPSSDSVRVRPVKSQSDSSAPSGSSLSAGEILGGLLVLGVEAGSLHRDTTRMVR